MPCSPEGQMDRRLNQFEKFHTLDAITASLAAKYPCDSLAKTNTVCGVIPDGSFYEIVNPASVHKSLAGYSNIAEARFAYTVTSLINENKTTVAQLQQDIETIGAADAAPSGLNAQEAFQYILLRYLDGMPCDDTKEIISSNTDCVVWRKVEDSHQPAWVMVGGYISIYYALLQSYINGLLCDTAYKLTVENEELFTIA